MKSIITNFHKRYQKPLAITLLLYASCWIQPAKAEGSKELVADGGNRPYIEWSASGTTAGIARRTTLFVYVQTGETINLGSSVIDSFDGKDIVYFSPTNIERLCDVKSSGEGLIDTVAKETKGPEVTNGDGGYKPCQFVADETGFYRIEFHAPLATGDPPPKLASEQFPIDSAQGQTVAAWDITIRDSAGVTKLGRVLTNYVALNMGGGGLSLNSKLYVQTKDGYRYETDMNQLDPFGFIFFANSRGYIDQTNKSTVYHSAKANDSQLTSFEGNIKVQNPEAADTDTDITHLIFLNRPDSALLTAIGIPTTPIPPSAPSDFKFTRLLGGSGNQTTVGKGGYFSFTADISGTYQIIIDTNADGIFDPSTDRVLQDPVLKGIKTVFWDGKKADGTDALPRPLNQPYNAQIIIRAGEYHFPMLDVENNNLGFKITLENPPTAFPPIRDQNGEFIGKSTIYYNDDNYTTGNKTTVSLDGTTASTPRNALAGVNSSTGKHQFSNSYGDFKGIDTWSYFPSSTVTTPFIITSPANLRLVKRVTNIGGFAITGFYDVTTGSYTADDNAPGWITTPTYLEGAFDSSDTNQVPVANQPKPGDEVEYKIYFLADGEVDSQNVKICDFIPNNSTYVPNSLQLKIGNSAPVTITDAITDTDGGFYPAAPFPSACTSTSNNEGAILVNVGTVNFSTGVGTPTNSYGYVSFRAKVKN